MVIRYDGFPHLPCCVRCLEDHISFGVFVSYNEVNKAGLGFLQCIGHPPMSLKDKVVVLLTENLLESYNYLSSICVRPGLGRFRQLARYVSRKMLPNWLNMIKDNIQKLIVEYIANIWRLKYNLQYAPVAARKKQ